MPPFFCVRTSPRAAPTAEHVKEHPARSSRAEAERDLVKAEVPQAEAEKNIRARKEGRRCGRPQIQNQAACSVRVMSPADFQHVRIRRDAI